MTRAGDALLFGSEIKALLAPSGRARRAGPRALLEYFTFQNFFTDRTLFAGVRTAAAGHMAAHATRGDADCRRRTRYWDFDFREPATGRDEREYLRSSTGCSARRSTASSSADVPVGSYL